MGVIRFFVSDNAEAILKQRAAERNLSLQDFIREELLGKVAVGGLSVEDVVKQIRIKKPQEPFFISDLFDAETWGSFSGGIRGIVGKHFYEAVQAGDLPDVTFNGMKKRKATYCYKAKEE